MPAVSGQVLVKGVVNVNLGPALITSSESPCEKQKAEQH